MSNHLFFDKEGRPIDIPTADRLLSDMDYVRVGQETVGPYWVSTIWLGVNRRVGDGPPILFETMVFAVDGTPNEFDCRRYCTEEQARQGHDEMVTLVRATTLETPWST
jgi:hypothetical protein